MKTILVFDTETTGLPPKNAGISDPRYPEIVQFAACLCDDVRVYQEVNFIIKPMINKISDEVASIHGITQDIAEYCGIGRGTMVATWEQMVRVADIVVAHNIEFDIRMMQALYYRLERQWVNPRMLYCTMKATTNICKLPGRYGNFKWPTLAEAYMHLFNSKIEGAHNARIDLEATLRVYRVLTNGE